MTVLIPVLVTIIGALTYALAPGLKIGELGRIAFAAGILVTLVLLAGSTIRVVPA